MHLQSAIKGKREMQLTNIMVCNARLLEHAHDLSGKAGARAVISRTSAKVSFDIKMACMAFILQHGLHVQKQHCSLSA